MNRKTLRSILALLAPIGLVPTLGACPKKDLPVIVDAGLPVAVAVEDAALDLQPEGADASDASDSEAEADAPKQTGPYVPANVQRIRECCAQLNQQATTLGISPEAGFLRGLAQQCYATATSVQKNPNAPELTMLKTAIAGRNVPAVCRNF